MKMEKPSVAAVALYQEALPADRRVEPRTMFGCPCAFANGYMFFGVFADDVFVRLDEPSRAAYMRLPGARVFAPMTGRPMREYVVATDELKASPENLDPWVARALAYVTSLPPKTKRMPGAKRTGATGRSPANKPPGKKTPPKRKRAPGPP